MNKQKIAILSLAAILFLVSCGSDDDAKPSVTNTIKLDGEAFSITAPSLMGVSIDGEGHAGITFTNTNSTGELTKVLSIDFEYSPSESVSGTYSFPQGTSRFLDDWLTNYTEFSMSSGSSNSTNLESGTVTVTDNGNNNYTVVVDLTMIDGKHFEGKYSGKFTVAFNNG